MKGFWGKKIGMTQLFGADRKVIPVTALDLSDWKVIRYKTHARDGYDAVVVGFVRNAYKGKEVSEEWFKKPKKYFQIIREIPVEARVEDEEVSFKPGDTANIEELFTQGDRVAVTGTTIGKGFAGVMKRHGFSGGPASHGSTLGRRPGSISFMATQGRVPKGKKLPGHMGVEQQTVKNLKVVKIEPSERIIFVSGSVPGKAGSLVYVSKNG